MPWITGTAAFTNGSTTVTSAGADWLAAAVAGGDAVLAPDGRTYEIDAVLGATSLRLVRAYAGATVAAGTYDIAPLQQRNRAVAAAINQLIADFQASLDGPGAGRFGSGTAAAPGVTFNTDRDTGLFNPAPDVVALGAGGVEGLRAVPGGVVVGTNFLGGANAPRLHVLESSKNVGVGVRSLRSEAGAGVRGLTTTLLQGSGASGSSEGNVTIRFHHNDFFNLSGRLSITTRDDENIDGERLAVDHTEVRASVQHRPFAGTWSSGVVYSKVLGTPGQWVTLAIIPKSGAGAQKSVQFRLQVHVEENGGMCPFELAGYFYDRSNVLPHPDILNLGYFKPFGELQTAAGLTQFRLTTLGVTNGPAYLQAMNPSYAVVLGVLSIWNNYGLSHFNWQ